jgi:transcriptional regulator with PAS, ATPase and Fis domain
MSKVFKEKHSDRFGNMVGKDSKTREIYRLIKTISQKNTTVLIMGETGTGKELVARAIHQNSQRKYKSYLKIDCTALPETLLESELFGYRKGAFTDARVNKPGKFEMADSGTIFLDEIGELPRSIQAKLLRVLEEQAFEPLGSIKTIKVDVRIIAATNRDLLHAIAQGQFRQDLYYRLNVFPIVVPPLRDRPEDIPLLVGHFIETTARRIGRAVPRVSRATIDLFLSYSWPGNVRQLKHGIEYALIRCEGNVIENIHLPEEIREKRRSGFMKPLEKDRSIREIERELIINALARNNSNRRMTAKALQISRTTLWRKMQKYSIE